MISLPQLSRLGLYFFLLLFTVIYQLRYPLFINFDFLIPIYCLLSLALMVSAIFLYLGMDKERLNEKALKILLPLDAVVISLILYKTSLQNSLYLFFYLYLIFITALSFQLRGALAISVFCSALFTAVLFVDTSMGSNSKIFLFLMNNLAFFVVAYLSGGLSTQLQAREKDIKELKNINNLIVDNIKTGLMTLDQSFKVIQSNQALKDILHTSVDSKFDIHQVVDLHDLKDDLSKKQVINKEVQYKLGDERRHLDILVSKLNLQELESGYLLLVQDVTEKKKIEDRLKNQEKLAAVGQLAAGIAHEIRNPLASMSGSVQLLATSFERIDDEQKKLIAITLKETDRLNNLISEFLEFVRPNLPMDDRVDVSKLLRDCLELLQLNKTLVTPILDLNIQNTKAIQANRDKLKQVFLNIMINACHAMEKISAEFGRAPQLKVSCVAENNIIEVRIKDNGVGMEEKVRVKMFEPFFTTKPRGTGLGLAIVHKILESHNAIVDVESKVGSGTEFIIKFNV